MLESCNSSFQVKLLKLLKILKCPLEWDICSCIIMYAIETEFYLVEFLFCSVFVPYVVVLLLMQ